MNKVVLVLDKPRSCMSCLCLDGETGDCKAGGIIEDIENPTRCPLKAVKYKEAFGILTDYDRGKILGHNACVRKMLGE